MFFLDGDRTTHSRDTGQWPQWTCSMLGSLKQNPNACIVYLKTWALKSTYSSLDYSWDTSYLPAFGHNSSRCVLSGILRVRVLWPSHSYRTRNVVVFLVLYSSWPYKQKFLPGNSFLFFFFLIIIILSLISFQVSGLVRILGRWTITFWIYSRGSCDSPIHVFIRSMRICWAILVCQAGMCASGTPRAHSSQGYRT